MTIPIDAIGRGLEVFAALVRGRSDLSRELEATLGEFFGGPPPGGDPLETLVGARRHLEWFVLERHSPTLFGVPVERLLDPWLEGAREGWGEDPTPTATALLDSFCGVFQVGDVGDVGDVGEVEAPGGVWLEDLAGLGSYPLDSGHGMPLAQGDLLVGRLFPVGEGLHQPSRAAALFREPRLVAAVKRDLIAVRRDSPRKVLHVSQRDLEVLFWGSGREPLPLDPVGAARRFLEAAGVDGRRVRELMGRLSGAPFDPARWVHGVEDALGEILDELAFETGMDLVAARRHLGLAWPVLAGARSSGVPSSAHHEAGVAKDPRAAVEAFAQGRDAGADLERLFTNLERSLGLEGGSGGPDEWGEGEEETPAPDFPGVVGALVEEFLWDTARQGDGDTAARHACLHSLSEYGQRIGLLEELDSTELLRFTTFWILERGTLGGASQARQLLDALGDFCAWAEEAHGLALRRGFGATLEGLRETLPRIVELNHLLEPVPAPGPEGESGELYEVRQDGRGRYGRLRDRAGRDHRPAVDPGLVQRLRPGDRLRGAISAGGDLTIYRCYPPQSAGLLV